jgi:hypothetical protein
MTQPTHILDHADEALAQLLSFIRSDEALAELVEIIGDSVQDLEDLIWECLVERYLDAAVGVQLDAWGEVLGHARDGLSDTEYSRLLQAWQGALRGQGRRDLILRALIAVAAPSETWFFDLTNASYEVDLILAAYPPTSALEQAILDVAEASAPSGVQYLITVGDATTPFQFDTVGRGFNDGQLVRRLI